MKIWNIISKSYLILIGLIMIVFSFDSLFASGNVFERILGFFIHSLPGIAVLLVTLLFRSNNFIRGIITFALAIFFIFFFNPLRDLSQGWFVFFFIVLPLGIIGSVTVILNYPQKKN